MFQDFQPFPLQPQGHIDTEGRRAEGVREVLAERYESQVERLPGGMDTYLNKASGRKRRTFPAAKTKLASPGACSAPASW